MIITAPGYMQTRSLEAGLGLMMLVSGGVFVLPGATLAHPVYEGLRAWMPPWMSEEMGGTLLVVLAIVRWWALLVNSRIRSTPLFRLLGCMVGAAFWATAFSSVLAATPHLRAAPWILVLTGALTMEEMYSGFRTGLDADALDSLGLRRWAAHRRRRTRARAASRA